MALLVVGFLLMFPGVLWLFLHGLSEDDAAVALSPLVRIPLDQLERAGSAAVDVTIPESRQWKRIRHEWGEPDYLIVAVEDLGRRNLTHCLDELGIHVSVTSGGRQVALKIKNSPPYGYQGTCTQSGGFELRADPGMDLTIRASSVPRRMPAGELVLLCSWQNVKDKLVGVYVDEDMRTIFRIAALTGMVLIASGAAFHMLRRASGRRS